LELPLPKYVPGGEASDPKVTLTVPAHAVPANTAKNAPAETRLRLFFMLLLLRVETESVHYSLGIVIFKSM
jgi:hypothetical protein